MQDRAIAYLKTSITAGKLPHSLLFFGPEGVGKTLTAKALAKALNCPAMGPADFCNECESCVKIEKANHPDVHWIEPEGAANKIKIEKIRKLKEEINLKPFEAKTKVFIVDKAHFLADEAANSMLKVLEEPPADSVIILVSDDLGSMLPTIRSRCQWVVFSQAGADELKAYLIDAMKMGESEAHFLAHLSEGRIGKAVSMDAKGALGWKNGVIDGFSAENVIYKEDPLYFGATRAQTLEALEVLLGWYRDIFVTKCGGREPLLINVDRLDDIKQKAGSFSEEGIRTMLSETMKAHSHIRRNVNPKLAMADLACAIG